MALRWSLFSTLSLSLSLKLLTVSTPYPPRRCVAVMRVSLLLYSDKLRPLSPSKFSSLSLSPSPAAVSPHAKGALEWAEFTGHDDKHGLGGGLGGGFYNLLSAFVGIPTISGSTAFQEPCWQVC